MKGNVSVHRFEVGTLDVTILSGTVINTRDI